MNEDQLRQLRIWVCAEIEYSLAQSETDEEGYTSTCARERDVADTAFYELTEVLRKDK